MAVELEEQVISRAQWPEYVNGSSVAELVGVRKILLHFNENDKVNITIQYPGGDQGIQWARQMYQWFIAFGVPGRYLRMELGSGAPDQLRLLLVNKN